MNPRKREIRCYRQSISGWIDVFSQNIDLQEGLTLTILQILTILIVGVIILAVGIAKKSKCAAIVSAVLLLIVLSQFVALAVMALH